MLSARSLGVLAVAASAAVLYFPAIVHAAPPQPTSTTVVLPLKDFADIAVTSTQVFVSGGTRAPGIAVTDLKGGSATTIRAGAGATDLALSRDGGTLYAVLPHAAAISAIDTRTMKQKARYATGVCPHDLAVTDRVWFSYSCRRGEDPNGVGSVDVASPKPTVRLGVDEVPDGQPHYYHYPPVLAAARTTNVIAVGETGISSGMLWVHRQKEDGTLTRISQGADGNSLDQVALTPDGTTLYVSGDVQELTVYATEDLTPRGRLEAEWGLNAVSVAPAGDRVAASNKAALFLYATADGSVEPKIPLEGADLEERSLAWRADGRGLYAVSVTDTAAVLHVVEV